jgi:AcrR family transcriptional regulator
LFNRHGFNAVSIDDVMAEAGLTRGSFYCYFSSKSDLYAQSVARVVYEGRENPKANGSERARADKIVRDYLSVADHEETGETFPMIGCLTTFHAPIAWSGRHSSPLSNL